MKLNVMKSICALVEVQKAIQEAKIAFHRADEAIASDMRGNEMSALNTEDDPERSITVQRCHDLEREARQYLSMVRRDIDSLALGVEVQRVIGILLSEVEKRPRPPIKTDLPHICWHCKKRLKKADESNMVWNNNSGHIGYVCDNPECHECLAGG